MNNKTIPDLLKELNESNIRLIENKINNYLHKNNLIPKEVKFELKMNQEMIKCKCGREYPENYAGAMCPKCEKIWDEANDDLINEVNELFDEVDEAVK